MSDFGVSQKALIFNGQGQLLTLFRTATAPGRPNTWDFPGGDLEHGEDLVPSLRREITEETGLAVTDIKMFDAEAHLTPENIHWVTLAYRCRATTDQVTISWEHGEYRWVSPAEFLALPSDPRFQQFVRNLAPGPE